MSSIAINPSLQSGIRLTPRGRLLARLAVVASLSILLISAFSALNGASAGTKGSAEVSSYIKVSVKPGETLWSIAAKIASSKNFQGDPRELVDELMVINNLESPRLEAGEKIYLPTR